MTIPQQRALLVSRGMAVPDPPKTDEYLQRIGYYRLSAYWFPFRKLSQLQDGSFKLGDDFKDGTEFKHATDLYAFDKGLRLLVLDAIERIEISVRTEVALTIGRHGPKAHRDPTKVDGRFTTIVQPKPQSMYTDWLNKLSEKEANSKEEFAVHFRYRYNGDQMPIWIAVELLDFGPLSIFLSGMKYADLQSIAASYGIARPHLVRSWIRSLSAIRNVCAHHSRLWNKPLIDQPALPAQGEIPEFDHIVATPSGNHRLYAALAIIRLLLKRINPRTKWADRLKAHVATFPGAPNIKISDMGFPTDWENLPLWN
ncbi:MAG: Abi family protein [Mesorhizobium sp.]|nr:MAG: Abi family protein [Mesorhizobium sp.]TIQ14711.1 MAG: Abi family protein [Mesorhizobium sp.]TIR52191.1 MAG: Abi family protein [Mesorhizobium sp.]TJV96328.1 MAG: Abi family protein [Mesorhizobium sp.]